MKNVRFKEAREEAEVRGLLPAASPLRGMKLRNGRPGKGRRTFVGGYNLQETGRTRTTFFRARVSLVFQEMYLALRSWTLHSGTVPGAAPEGSSEVTHVNGKNCNH